jgi:hypothetical protein
MQTIWGVLHQSSIAASIRWSAVLTLGNRRDAFGQHFAITRLALSDCLEFAPAIGKSSGFAETHSQMVATKATAIPLPSILGSAVHIT